MIVGMIVGMVRDLVLLSMGLILGFAFAAIFFTLMKPDPISFWLIVMFFMASINLYYLAKPAVVNW